MGFFINATDIVGPLLSQGTNDVTGSLFLTLFIVFMVFVLLGLMFRLGIAEITIIMMPMLIALMAYYSEWYAVGGIMLIALGVIFAKNFFVQAR